MFILCEDVSCILGLLSAPEIALAGVGKSCLLLRFSDDTFTTSFITTIGYVNLCFFSAGFICTQGNDASQVLMLFSPCVEEEEQRRLCLNRSPSLQD